jgi:photosystem II stability/assembly factor-like uncharacterized protein
MAPRIYLLTLLLAVSGLAPLRLVRADEVQAMAWKPLGLSGGGAMFGPAISPVDGKLMMLNCDMSAAYLSTDGGQNWRMLSYDQVRGNTNCRPAFHPTDPNIIYAASGWEGIKVTHDQGTHWESCGPLPGQAQGEIAIDSGNPACLLVGVDSGVARSTDGGATWTRCDGPHGKALGFHFDLTSPKDRRVCFAATTEGVWRSDDGGATWKDAAGGLPSREILAFAGGSNAKDSLAILYCSVTAHAENDRYAGGIYLSEDRGATWKPAGLNGLNTETKAFDEWAESPVAQYVQLLTTNANPRIVYAFNSSTGVPPPHHASVYRSEDAGQSWHSVYQRDPRYQPCNVEPDYMVAADHQSTSGRPLGVAINANNPDEVLNILEGPGFVTGNGGRTWTCVHTRLAPGSKIAEDGPTVGAQWLCNGLVVTTTWNFYIDPFEPNRRYICYTDIGFARSLDRGKSWQWWDKNGRPPWPNTCYELAFDPLTKGKIWGAFSEVHDIPNNNIISGNHSSARPGGVGVSTDFAATWKESSDGLPRAPVVSVIVDPKSAPGARTLYAGLFGYGVFKSVDDGRTWKSASNGLGSKTNQRVISIQLQSDGMLWALVTANRIDGKYQGDGVGLYRSTDGAASWSLVNGSLPLLWPKGFTLDPKDSRTIYLSAADAREEKQGGLYRTTDGGTTWKKIAREGPEHFGAFLSPVHPGWIYLTLCEDAPGAGLWLSRDDGATWSPMTGLPFSNVQRVAFDPEDPASIYVTTFGGSVWQGPSAP